MTCRVLAAYRGQPGSPSVTNRTQAPCMSRASPSGGAWPATSVTPGSPSVSKTNGISREWMDRPRIASARDPQAKS